MVDLLVAMFDMKKMLVATATGEDLDRLANRFGISRDDEASAFFRREWVPLTDADPYYIDEDGAMRSTEPGGGPMGTFPAPAGFRWERDDEFRARIKRTMQEVPDGA